MQRTLLRTLALATTLALITTGIGSITDPAPASASGEDSIFVLTVFPHDTEDLTFWDSWGARRSGGRRHQGIDIMSPRGTEIVAVADGVVTKLGKSRLSGYFIRLDHADGWATSYMHLNNDTFGTDDGEGGTWTAFFPTLMEGDEVRAGQVIGYVGDSGNAEGTRPHTHFEIKHDGKKTNPYPYLLDALERENPLPAGQSAH
jgi:murein DD-endopeptidase MepM/ murein hydrolase activator NlpD